MYTPQLETSNWKRSVTNCAKLLDIRYLFSRIHSSGGEHVLKKMSGSFRKRDVYFRGKALQLSCISANTPVFHVKYVFSRIHSSGGEHVLEKISGSLRNRAVYFCKTALQLPCISTNTPGCYIKYVFSRIHSSGGEHVSVKFGGSLHIRDLFFRKTALQLPCISCEIYILTYIFLRWRTCVRGGTRRVAAASSRCYVGGKGALWRPAVVIHIHIYIYMCMCVL